MKLTIDSALDLTRLLVEDANGATTATIAAATTTDKPPAAQESTLAQLEALLLTPKSYVQPNLQREGVPAKPADLYLQSYKSTSGDLPFQKALVQSGDVDAWKRLKRREKALEKSSSIREALNAYTDAVTFSSESYLLRVDPATRSSMVREDRLPDIKQVITSDMGMRYLYRNQVLTAMDDVRAELEYQLKQQQQKQQQQQSPQSFDGRELLDLLGLARDAMDRWLSLVPPSDVREALEKLAAEEGFGKR